MNENTNFVLGQHFDDLLEDLIKSSHYTNKREAMRARLRRLETETKRLEVVKKHLAEGERQANAGELHRVDKERFKQVGNKNRPRL